MAELNLSGAALYDVMVSFFSTNPDCRMKIQCPGTSMSPFIRHNSVLTLAPFQPGSRPRFGDIVITAVHAKKKILIHRVIAFAPSPPRYLIKGDNNKACDGWFHEKEILGCVEKIENRNFHYSPAPWQNALIGTASKTGVLNHILVPAARYLRRCLTQWKP